MTPALGPRGLRARIVLAFAVGTLLVSAVLVTTTWFLARSYLLDQREAVLTRQAFADANVLASRLSTAGAEVGDALVDLVPSGGARVVVRSGDAWYSSALEAGRRDVPVELRGVVDEGDAGRMRVATAAGPHLVVGVPVVAQGISFYEFSSLAELQESLQTLAGVLGAGALAATAAGAVFGLWASRRAVQPLEQVAGAATRIAGGELTTRLPATDDPDLVGIVAGFNSMVDALAARLARDARFVADVSHELRSPLTSLVTTVEVLAARRDELSPRGRQALDLIEGELGRFRSMLDDLLELARLDEAGTDSLTEVSVTALVREVLARTGRPADLLEGTATTPRPSAATSPGWSGRCATSSTTPTDTAADRSPSPSCAATGPCCSPWTTPGPACPRASGSASSSGSRAAPAPLGDPPRAPGSGWPSSRRRRRGTGGGLVRAVAGGRCPVQPLAADGAAVRRLALLLACVVCAALAGCGVPIGTAPQRIPASDIPYGLASAAPPSAAPLSSAPVADDPRVYLVTAQDLLVARGRDVTGPTTEGRLRKLLADLAFGPSRQDLAEQLSTALRPEVRLTVESIEDGVATISIAAADGGQSTGEGRRAVAQIVLTATSVPGIDAVLLSAGGEVVEAPLPSGELTSRPLTATDYTALLASPRPR